MTIRKTLWSAALLLLASAPAFAQSNPGLVTGQVPTAAQWNSYFAAKQDALGYSAVNRAGDTMTGRLSTVASNSSSAGFRVPHGAIPISPVNGDFWTTTSGAFVRINGATVGPLAGISAANFAATSPLSVSFPSSVVTYALTANGISNAFLRQGVARSVIGVTGNATSNVADIQGSASQFLGVNAAGTVLAFQTLAGDVTLSGPTATLASVISAGGPTGSATVAPIITYDAKGRLTTVSSATITPAVGSITGFGTGVGAALATNVGSAGAPVLFNGAGGTPSSLTLTNATGLPIAGTTGYGTGVATALAINVGSAGAFTTFNGAGGTPSSITLTNGTGLPTTGLTGTLQAAQEPAHTGDVTNSAGSLALSITANAVTLAKLATQATNTVLGNATSGTAVPTALAVGTCSTAASALNWTTNTGFGCNTSITAAAAPISGLTGAGTGVLTALGVNVGSAGAFVVNGGALGTPSSGVGTNLTGTASGLTAGNVTTNANLTGDVTSVGNATTLATVASAGTTGSSTAIPVITINAKGLTTSITTAAVVAPAGTLSGATLASGVTASSLTSVGAGTIGSIVTKSYTATTWTPTLVGAGTAGTPTYTTQIGSYEQIDRLVIARFNIATSALGGAAGSMQIGGLPVTSNATTNDFGSCHMGYVAGVTFDTNFSSLTALVGNSATTALMKESGTANSQNIDASKFAAATQVIGVCFYHS